MDDSELISTAEVIAAGKEAVVDAVRSIFIDIAEDVKSGEKELSVALLEVGQLSTLCDVDYGYGVIAYLDDMERDLEEEYNTADAFERGLKNYMDGYEPNFASWEGNQEAGMLLLDLAIEAMKQAAQQLERVDGISDVAFAASGVLLQIAGALREHALEQDV